MRTCDHFFYHNARINFLPAAQCFCIHIINPAIPDIILPDNVNCFHLLAVIKQGQITIGEKVFCAGDIIATALQPGIVISFQNCTLRGYLIPAQAYPCGPYASDPLVTRRATADSEIPSLISHHIDYSLQKLPLLKKKESMIYQYFLSKIIPDFISSIPITDSYTPQNTLAEKIWFHSRPGNSRNTTPAAAHNPPDGTNDINIKPDHLKKINLNRSFFSIIQAGPGANIKNISFLNSFTNETRFSDEFRKRFSVKPTELKSYLCNKNDGLPLKINKSLLHL